MSTSQKFDHQHRLVSSYMLPPLYLSGVRLLIGGYALTCLVFMLVWGGVKTKDLDMFLSYFTNLGFVGICAYFLAAGVQTFVFGRKLKEAGTDAEDLDITYPLQTWPRIFGYLHRLLLSTIVTFPLLVTIVYWTLIASPESFASSYITWSNVSKHMLNAVFALFEILCTNVPPMPLTDLPVTLAMLGGYLGLAYVTYETQREYSYSFLDPSNGKKKLVAYIIGIAVGQCVAFSVVRGIIQLRGYIIGQREKTSPDVLVKYQG